MLSFEFFSYDETRSSIPLPLIEATCNHAQEPLLLPNGRATIPQEIFPIPISISKISFDKPSPNNSMKFPCNTFGSKNTTGFGSRMQDSNKPFACCGLRGMITYTRTYFERFDNNTSMLY